MLISFLIQIYLVHMINSISILTKGSSSMNMKQELLKTSITAIRKLTEKQETLDMDNKFLRREITQELKGLSKQVQSFKEKIRMQLTAFRISLEEDSQRQKNAEGTNLVSIIEIGKYLQQQKQFLKNLITAEERSSEETTDKLHCLLNKKHFEGVLLSIRQKELSEQIRFLETNVLVGSGVSYDINAPLAHEEVQIKEEIERKVVELERVMELTISCYGVYQIDGGHRDSIQGLARQRKRLESVEKVLTEENRKIKEFEAFLSYFPSKAKEAPIPELSQSSAMHTEHKQRRTERPRITSQELEELQNFMIPEGQALTMTIDHEKQIEERMNQLRRKVRKIEAWVR